MADKKTDVPQEPADTYQRHGEVDPSGWEEQPVVTDRPNDLEVGGKAPTNSTFGDRTKAANKATTKAVKADEVEDKSLKRSTSK